MERATAKVRLHDYEPRLDTFREEVLQGLQCRPKRLPSKFFYDERGSRLFDRICELEEYYPTRTELATLRRHGPEIAAAAGPRCRVVEYGSGSGVKTRVLLDHLDDPVAYVPIDISREHLIRAVASLARVYPRLEILPVCADYTESFALPASTRRPTRTVAFFPGSTIGNFEPDEAVAFLRGIAAVCGPGGGLLIGVDLRKDPAVLRAAYDDREGITAAFNLNLLHRIKRELDPRIELDRFAHRVRYNRRKGRIEMHIVSLADQLVRVGDTMIAFRRGEKIITEYSHKYTLRGFSNLATRAGFEVRRVWTDERRWFSVQYLAVR